MAKLALLFVAVVCCLVQIGFCGRIEKRDVAPEATEITTEGFFSMVKSGFSKTFSDENLNKAKTTLGNFGTQAKELGSKAVEAGSSAYSNLETGVKKLLNNDETTTTAPIVGL